MNPEKQRIAIAEACGWTEIHTLENGVAYGWHPTKHWKRTHRYATPIPDYLNDLNAMHEAEKALWGKVGWTNYSHVLLGDNIHANAAQRAEAFLRTIGKWEE